MTSIVMVFVLNKTPKNTVISVGSQAFSGASSSPHFFKIEPEQLYAKIRRPFPLFQFLPSHPNNSK